MLNKMKSLIAQLKEADAAYYGKDNPIMTNLEYDRLYNELAQLERDTGIILASSPTQRVSGEVLEGLSAVSHTSLDRSAVSTSTNGWYSAACAKCSSLLPGNSNLRYCLLVLPAAEPHRASRAPGMASRFPESFAFHSLSPSII